MHPLELVSPHTTLLIPHHDVSLVHPPYLCEPLHWDRLCCTYERSICYAFNCHRVHSRIWGSAPAHTTSAIPIVRQSTHLQFRMTDVLQGGPVSHSAHLPTRTDVLTLCLCREDIQACKSHFDSVLDELSSGKTLSPLNGLKSAKKTNVQNIYDRTIGEASADRPRPTGRQLQVNDRLKMETWKSTWQRELGERLTYMERHMED